MFLTTRFIRQIFTFFLMPVLCALLIFSTIVHADVTMDGTLGPQMTLSGPDFQIKAKYGKTINNTNLFHSFGRFNIDTNQSATFTGPDAIKNIIGRITGGTLSNIDGLIKSNFPTANLYLINPSGILLGPNATLDVNGSFHVTTADYLKLGNDGIFYADPAKESLLTVDAPAAFGFLGSSPADIVVNESSLEVPEGKILSLVGGDIEITGTDVANTGVLKAPGGRIDIASVSSEGTIIPTYSAEAPDLLTDSFENLGDIKLYLGGINTGGDGGGTIFIRGGKLTVDSSTIYASTKGASESTLGAGIDIKISGDMLADGSAGSGSSIGTNISGNVNEDSGGVRISADNLAIKNGAGIQSVALPGSSGQSGDIEINTRNLLIENSGYIQAGTGGSKKSGNIIINTDSLEIRDNGVLWTNAFNGTGDSGDISVTADNIFLSNEKYPGWLTGITTQTYWPGTGKGGNITLKTKNLQMLAGTEISTPTYYLGKGGDIKITMDEKGSITGGDNLFTGIFANTFWSGNGGNVEINADRLELDTRASVQVQTLSVGNAGNVALKVNSLEIKNGSYITTAGHFGGGGGSGKVDITAENIKISGFTSSTDPFGKDFTGISSSAGKAGGKGGNINLDTTNLEMTNRGLINSASFGPDNGGNINVKSGDIQILNGSAITASAWGTGDGGVVDVNADNILISGVHPEIYLFQDTGMETLAPSSIASQAGLNGGKGGDMNIQANTLKILDGGLLAADTFGTGNAGNINIISNQLLVSGENADMKQFLINNGWDPKQAASDITTSTSSTNLDDFATGNGGNILINTKDLMIKDSGSISSDTTTPGKGGNIEISAWNASLFSGASISAMSRVSENAGQAGNINISAQSTFNMDNASLLTSSEKAKGGDINIKANDIDLVNNTNISAQSSGQGDAGSIYLAGQNTFFMNTSKVTTEAKQADGGDIKVYADYMIHLIDSEILASVGGGSETTGGNISIDPEFIIFENSQIIANAFEGIGGNIEIVSEVFLSDPDSIIDASSSLGIDGQVDIRSPITSVSSVMSPLSKDFQSVVALLRQPCMARMHKGEYSSFMIKGRDSLPAQPGRFLSSPLSTQ